MKIYAIRNGETARPLRTTRTHQCRQTNLSLHADEPKADTVAFKSKTVKGAGIGAVLGVAALGAISLLSGGLATPLAFGVYAATTGTAGGMLGNVLDKIDEDEKERKNR